MKTIEKRVKRGITLLDKTFPIWRIKVNPNQLDLGSATNGILEQVFDGQLGYFRALQQLDLGLEDGYAYGFDISIECGHVPPPKGRGL